MTPSEQAAFDKMREALEEADDYLADCDTPPDRKVRVMVDEALSAAKAVLKPTGPEDMSIYLGIVDNYIKELNAERN